MNFVDTHAHIYAEAFRKDLDEVMELGKQAKIGKIYMPNVDHESIDRMLEMEQLFPDTCIAMMGLHPCHVKEDFQKELYLVEEWLGKRPFAALGEVGTDLYWDKTTFPWQTEALKIQVQLAKKYKLPIIIHCRNSFTETIEILEAAEADTVGGIFHCFGGTLSEAERAIKLGFLLGIGGVSTYKNGGLDLVLPHIDLKNLVLETDCPYLAPVPYRGKRNQPSYVPVIASRIAEIKQCSIGEVAETTTANALELFKL